MTKQILAFFFCFIRELTLYSPLTFSLIPRANSNLTLDSRVSERARTHRIAGLGSARTYRIAGLGSARTHRIAGLDSAHTHRIAGAGVEPPRAPGGAFQET
jgi:hypothetical protein